LASNPEQNRKDTGQQQFVALLLANQRRVTTYIATLLCSPPDVDDLFQEASIVMWQKFHTFQPGTNFAAWACRIAHLKVLEFRRRRRRGPVLFSDELLDSLAQECNNQAGDHQRQHEKLAECIAELGPSQRGLLQLRFAEKSSLAATAKNVGHAINTVRRQLQSVYSTLMKCVAKKLTEDQGP
jgi:RNA polymerase sigma-70 factor, ECF subfamily